MPQPTPYTRGYSFEDFQTASPDTPLPGDRVDTELDDIALTLSQVLANLVLIQRDDGELANGSVGIDQLASDVSLGFISVGDWATSTVYEARDGVWKDNALYRCATAHTSGVFATDLAASKWVLVLDFNTYLSAASDDADAAAASAATAATQAGNASASAAAAATQAGNASASAASAATQAGNAATSAADAQTYANAAASYASGLDFKPSVHLASTANIDTSSPGATLDSVAMVNGRSYLLKDQSTPSQNGIWDFNGAASAMTRRADADTGTELTSGTTVYVEEGTVNATRWYTLTTSGTITVGTTAQTWTQTGSPAVSASIPLAVTAGNIALDIANTTAETAIGALDLFLFYDVSAAAWRKITHENVVKGIVEPFVVAPYDEANAFSAATGIATFRMPFAGTLVAVRASLKTGQTSGSTLTIDVNKNGTTVLSTKLTIDNGEKTSVTAAAAAVISVSSFADDDEVTLDLDAVGDGTARGLKVTLYFARA